MAQFPTEKYIFKPYPYSSHSVILSWLERFPKGTRVLDVGTATGYIGKMVQHRGFELYGLEPQPQWLEAARPYYKDIVCAPLEDVEPSYLSGHQVVLLADVLEHMPNPDKELARLISYQQEGTVFIVSVPNIANIWVRQNLLFGRFDYAERGILDRTHMRFFTRSSFCAFLERAGLRIRELRATPIPLGLVNPFFVNNWAGQRITDVLMAVTKLRPTLLGYQWITQCEVIRNGQR